MSEPRRQIVRIDVNTDVTVRLPDLGQRRRAFRAGGDSSAKRGAERETGGRDRRRHYRASLRFPVHVRAKKEGRSTSVRAGAHDISTGGMLVANARHLRRRDGAASDLYRYRLAPWTRAAKKPSRSSKHPSVRGA
jgi:hypothetical protein